jgi:hypothetical protein
MNDQLRNVDQTYMNYLSAVSHGKSARKVDKLREKTVNVISDTRFNIAGLPPYKGDKTLRDATVNYLKICYSVFNEDYSKIVNMEEIAEQSYDAMEAYLLAQQKAGEKLEQASQERGEIAKTFAKANNINLIDTKDALGDKLKQSALVNDYYYKIFLIFFKSNKQDAYLTQAINNLDINSVEQNRNALLNYSTQGLEDLSSLTAFQSDASLVAACQKVLQFYKEMVEKRIDPVTNYIVANDNFKKMKKSFEAKPAAQRTQKDIDEYNKSINEINKAGNTMNNANNEINKNRNDMIKLWNDTVKDFMDNHIPYAK